MSELDKAYATIVKLEDKVRRMREQLRLNRELRHAQLAKIKRVYGITARDGL